jgi:hypothetical protein
MNDNFKFPSMAPVPLMVKDLTMRDHFAAQALQALLTRNHLMSNAEQAQEAYAMADALLKARDKK